MKSTVRQQAHRSILIIHVRLFGELPRVAYLKRVGIHFGKFEFNSKREQSGHDESFI